MSNYLHNVWSFANGSLLPNPSTPTRSSQTQAILDTVVLHPRSRRVYWIVVPQIRNEEYIITARGVSFSMPSLVVINYSRHLTRRPHASFLSHEVCSPAFHNKTASRTPTAIPIFLSRRLETLCIVQAAQVPICGRKARHAFEGIRMVIP